jgi:hypothetical protein
MSPQDMAARLMAVVDAAEAEGHDIQPIFHGVALAFGAAMARYLEPSAALTFMKQETGRVAQELASLGPSTLQ